MQPFAAYFQQASELSTQLKSIKDICFLHHIRELGGYIFTFIASLDTTTEVPEMVYNITCDNEPLHALSEIPPAVIADYGIFISYVEAWTNGGELHESLRHDD